MNINEWRVMVVEDEADNANLMSQLLSHYGAQVLVATNGIECLAQVESFWPTLIIMDLAMPMMDGWQTLKHLRLNPNVAHIPVIALTAFGNESVAMEAESAGFDAYYAKPIDMRVFISDLGAMLSGRG